MTKIRNTNIYKFDVSISDNDYVIGSDAETIGKITKNYKIGNLREYINAGLAPEVGGTLKITEVKYEGVLTTPSDVANNLSDTLEVLQYNVVVFNVNGDMYLLNLQNVSLGATEEPIFDYNFTLLSGSKNVGNGAKIIKGIDTDGKKQHRTLKSADTIVKIVENSDDIAVSVDETKLSQFVKDNQKTYSVDNVGTGVGVYKETTGLVHKFKTLKAENVGTGTFSLLKPITSTTNEVTISAKTIKTKNLDITEEPDGTLTIDTPVSTSNLSFYVDVYSTSNTETGTLSSPFKSLNKALDAFIGTGTWYNPQYKGYKITLLSNCDLLESPGAGFNGYVNLDVNELYIEGGGFGIGLYSNPTTDYYPISTRRMVANMPKTLSVLNYNIRFTIKNALIRRVGTNAIIDNLHYAFPEATVIGAFPPMQPTVSMTIENCILTNDTAPNAPDWTVVSDPNNSGDPLLFYGNTVYASNTAPIGVPMVKTEGLNWNKEGDFNLIENNFLNSTGTIIKIKNTTFTTFETTKNTIQRNNTRRYYQTKVNDFYSPKKGLYEIEVEDSRFVRFYGLFTNSTVPGMKTTEVSPRSAIIGGSECAIKIKNSVFTLLDSKGEDQYENYIQFDKDSRNIELYNFYDVAECEDAHGFFKVDSPLPLIGKEVYVVNSTINQVRVDYKDNDKSYIKQVNGFKNTINEAPHNSYMSFVDDNAATVAGLIKGNVYYNTTILGLKSII